MNQDKPRKEENWVHDTQAFLKWLDARKDKPATTCVMVNLPQDEYSKSLVKILVHGLNQIHKISGENPELARKYYGQVFDCMSDQLPFFNGQGGEADTWI